MRNGRKIFFIVTFVVASIVIVLFFSNKQKKQDPEALISSSQEEVEITNKEPKSLEDEIYDDIIGNLANYIDNNEEAKIKDYIKVITSLDDNESNKKSDIYKDIVKVLDQVTLRCCDVDSLEKYKKYYNYVTDADQNLEILSKYEINDDGTISGCIAGDQHEVLWEKAKKIIPFELIKDIKYFTPFKINQENPNAAIAGFMSPGDDIDGDQQAWSIGVNVNMDESQLPYILIHEYGHFISLKDAKMTLNDKLKPKAEGGKLLQSFIEHCNGHITDEFEVINESNQYLFYARHKDDFVTMYAATNFMEDFAESFARFITNSPCNTDRLLKKRNFFENDQHLLSLKKKILENLKSNGIETILECTV